MQITEDKKEIRMFPRPQRSKSFRVFGSASRWDFDYL